MILIKLILFFVSFLGLFFFVKKHFDISYNKTPFVTVSSLMLILYIGTMFGVLKIVSYLIYILGIVSFCFFSIKQKYYLLRFKKKDNVLLGFGILFFLNFLIYKSFILTTWDEFSFWGIFTKILVSFNDFVADFNRINKADYPRLTALIQYYFNLFLSDGKFNEGITIFAQVNLFLFALPLFLIKQLKRISYRNILYSVCFYSMIFVFVIPIFWIYNDALLGVFFAGSIVLYLGLKGKKNELFLWSLPLICLPLIKETGVIFAISALFIICIDFVFFRNDLQKIKYKLAKILFVFILILVSKFSWSLYLSSKDVHGKSFELQIEKIANKKLMDYQVKTIDNYLNSITFMGNLKENQIELRKLNDDSFLAYKSSSISFKDKIDAFNKISGINLKEKTPATLSEMDFSISLVHWVIILLIFGTIYFMYIKESIKLGLFAGHKNYIFFIGSILLVITGYSVLLLVLYLYSFNAYESVRLASFSRYMGALLLGVFLILFFLLNNLKNKWPSIIYAIAILLFTPGEAIEVFAQTEKIDNVKVLKDWNVEISPVIEKISQENEKAKILLIDQKSSGSFYVKFNFWAFPLTVNGWSYNDKEKWTGTVIKTREEFSKFLGEYDYLVVWKDDGFWEVYEDVVKKSELMGIWTREKGWLEK